MSQEVKSLNFAAEANYTVRLCKDIIAYHYPDKMPLGSFELVASNKVRSDEETLAEVFNGSSYACEKEVAEDPCFDWVPRKEQIFDEHKLMQLSIWKKEWDNEAKCFEPVDLGCAPPPQPRSAAPCLGPAQPRARRARRSHKPSPTRAARRYMAYGYEQTRKWRKMGFLNEKGMLKEEGQLISEGLITDETQLADYGKKLETIKTQGGRAQSARFGCLWWCHSSRCPWTPGTHGFGLWAGPVHSRGAPQPFGPRRRGR